MAMQSGAYGAWLRDMGLNAKAFELDSDTIKYQLVGDGYTPDFGTHETTTDITNEIFGTGYTTGGEELTSPGWSIVSGRIKFDGDNISLASTTLTNVRGLVMFDDTLSGDPLLFAQDFGDDFSTDDGTFAVSFPASGILTITFTP